MTEKRFKLIDGVKKGTHSGIWDNQKQHNQGIGDELWLGEVVSMLNEGVTLAEENEQLYELIDFANTLIAFKTSESCQKEWEKRLKELSE